MLKRELHPEVVKFLNETGTIWVDKDGAKSFVVNNSWYKPTDIDNVYTVEFLNTEEE